MFEGVYKELQRIAAIFPKEEIEFIKFKINDEDYINVANEGDDTFKLDCSILTLERMLKTVDSSYTCQSEFRVIWDILLSLSY